MLQIKKTEFYWYIIDKLKVIKYHFTEFYYYIILLNFIDKLKVIIKLFIQIINMNHKWLHFVFFVSDYLV